MVQQPVDFQSVVWIFLKDLQYEVFGFITDGNVLGEGDVFFDLQ